MFSDSNADGRRAIVILFVRGHKIIAKRKAIVKTIMSPILCHCTYLTKA